MNIFNPYFKKIEEWAVYVGLLLGILDCCILDTSRMGMIVAMMIPGGCPRTIGGYLFIDSFFSGYLLSFVMGSLMWTQLIAKYIYDINLREVGSGNFGVTNFARIQGVHWYMIVFVAILEVGKGCIALQYNDAYGVIWAVLGHIFSPWTLTGGGKGVAVYLGCALSYSPVIGFVAIATWCIMRLALHKEAFESSIISMSLIIFGSAHLAFVFAAILVYYTHSTWRNKGWHIINICDNTQSSIPDDQINQHYNNIQR